LLEAAEAVVGRAKEAGGGHGERIGIRVYSMERINKNYPANDDLYEVLT
jgi:hypothetical protein